MVLTIMKVVRLLGSRFNLDGTIAGYITKEEAAYARKRINEYKKKIKKDKIENKVEIEKNGQLTLF